MHCHYKGQRVALWERMVDLQVAPKRGGCRKCRWIFSKFSCADSCRGTQNTSETSASGISSEVLEISAQICWYYMPIVTAAISVVIWGTGTGAPALRAKPAEACNQAFWYGLVQSHPVESKHRWRPVIHVHR